MELKGKEYWRSLEQLAGTDDFKDFLEREFPKGTVELANNNWSRRSFLTTMGASLALAGLTSCRRPVEKIVPYVTRPEEIDPGVPNYYATTMPLGLSAYGVIVTTHEGRPTFIQGNPLHPSSKGAVNPIVQASLLDLYDPDRSRSVLHHSKESTWDDFVAWWKEQHAKYKQNGGEGLAVLSETFNSPTLARLKRQFHETFPKAQWVAWEPISDENIYKGIELATGRVLQPVYDFSRAKVVLALDCDFLGTESEAIANTAGFTEARRVRSRSDKMNRLYVVEPSMTVTGMMADHRVAVDRTRVGPFLFALARAVTARGVPIEFARGVNRPSTEIASDFVQALSGDLGMHRGECLVVAGRAQPPAVHAMACAMNAALGNVGRAVAYHEMTDMNLSSDADLAALAASVENNAVRTLIIAGGNPVFSAPRNLLFSSLLKKVADPVHLSSHVDETSLRCSWHLSRTHFLESWADAGSWNGTKSVVQPVIAPLMQGHGDIELCALLEGGEEVSAHDLVRETAQSLLGRAGFENKWRACLHDGVLPGSTPAAVVPKLSMGEFDVSGADGLTLGFACSQPFDGRFANNAWLQELPDPVTKLTWGNAALISPKLAEEYDLENEDVVELEIGGGTLEIPVWISPGQADNAISVALGYGRTAAGRVGNGVGFNAYRLRTSDNMWFATGVKLRKLGPKYLLACTQDHGSMEGRPIVRENTLAGYRETAEFYPTEIEHPPLVSLWDEHKYDKGYQWGMAIDLNACTGCNACVVACQAENNIPIVGKEQVRNGREMHWMRIDRYYAGDIHDPQVVVQPMNCQHCEMAPCEQVCPVAATSHDPEGLNVMVYNRCIGTRYCSNNCPYKVRRFNFFNYTNELPEVVKMAQNPEVTVRFRGVMEKCTYCIQRISLAKIKAKNEGRTVVDGEIKTACEAACPAKAIVFGNISDPDSRVAQLRKNDRKYRVLEELNTRPRTTYLAKLRNPNPALVKDIGAKAQGGHG